MEQPEHADEQQDLALAAVPAPAAAAAIALIPDDVLAADVFRRASPRGLAACRCVCRAWRALIDDRRLLRADLLPLSLAGLLLCLNVDRDNPELFARPGAAGGGYVIPYRSIAMDGHCNGLVLINDTVLNPATGRVARLPDCPPSPLWEERCFFEDRYLAFDPAAAESSPADHYQVFCIPTVFIPPLSDSYRAIARSEWPPSPFVLSVFSSVTGRWEARSLVRRGGAAGTADDMYGSLSTYEHLHWACWSGALYVHWQNNFVLRIPLSDQTTTYQVIKPPRGVEERDFGRLGRSEKGVYFAFFDGEQHLCVWILQVQDDDDDDDDSCGHTEWILKHRSAYGLALPSSPGSSSWTLHNAIRDEQGDGDDAQEWDSDDDGGGEMEDRIQERLAHFTTILGFHPYREIIFMFSEESSTEMAYAYHLKSSKLEDLGNTFPRDATPTPGCITYMENSFVYTPCWMEVP